MTFRGVSLEGKSVDICVWCYQGQYYSPGRSCSKYIQFVHGYQVLLIVGSRSCWNRIAKRWQPARSSSDGVFCVPVPCAMH